MNKQANVREFKRLESEIVADEADIEAKRWRQAELAAAAIAEGMSRVAYAHEVGKADSTIGVFVRVWDRWGASRRAARPLFADAAATIREGSEELVTRADQTRRQKERQVPSRHEDRTEMVETLLADPKVAKAVAKTVMDPKTRAGRLLTQAVHDRDAEDRRKRAGQERQAREDKALPLPAYMAKMVVQINDFGLGLAALVDDLDELPEGDGRELVLKAMYGLRQQADRWIERLEAKPKLRVIEGQATLLEARS